MRISLLAFLLLCAGCANDKANLLCSDDFQSDSHQWQTELEHGGTVHIAGSEMDIDVPAGATIWFRKKIEYPVSIEYDITPISAGGPNDRVSDVNCFWMARDSRNESDFFAVPRSGKFADYNQLLCYYASIGGNSNTTTRFRRYIGSPSTRPILKEHDLRDAVDLLAANQTIHIELIAHGHHIQFRRDGRTVFSYDDPWPYTSGYFAIRTTQNHMKVRNLRIYGPAIPGHIICRAESAGDTTREFSNDIKSDAPALSPAARSATDSLRLSER